MIYVDRSAVPLPAEFVERAKRATQKALDQARGLRRQQRLEFRSQDWMVHKPLLAKLFHGKCAYCESPLLATERGDFEHFRPKSTVAEDPKHPGYYWLVFAWENQYLVCRICNITKRNSFPIEGKRARTPTDSLADELPFLLDPCRDTAPESHLKFLVEGDQSGRVVGLTKRGEVTIEVLGLNREQLVRARAQEAEIVTLKLKALDTNRPAAELTEALKALQQPSLPYVAVRRAVISQFARQTFQAALITPPSRRKKRAGKQASLGPLDAIAHVGRMLEGAQPPSAAAPDAVALSSPQASPRTGYISRVAIRNFRSIASLDLKFDFARPGRAGWQVFLGENGTGKSSILQTMAIALIGRQNLGTLGLDARSILRLPQQGEEPPTEGSISIWLGTDLEPIEVKFDGSEIKYVHGDEGANILVRGYGPTRLMPRPKRAAHSSDASPDREGHHAKRVVDNLFDSYVSLCDAPAWLAGLEEDAFDKVALTIKDVLRFRNEDNIVFDRERGTVKALDVAGVPVSLDLLSHGQQSALVLATDIVSGIMADRAASGLDPVPGDFRECAGIILLDEIDAHLHPRWKMEIVPSLKRAFPFIQFLATTHEPLCLRGLEENEIIVVRREAAEVTAEISPISPKGWRVDQLLTSELFGLFSTIDPAIDAEFQDYYLLLSKPEADLTPKDQARLEHLRNNLRRHNRLGYTRRDQLLYEVIDEFLVKELQMRSHEERTKLRDETKRKVREIWQRVIATRDPAP